MDHSDYLKDVLVYLAAAVVVVPIFERIRFGPILGYLAAGMMIGPHGLAFVGDTEAAHTLAEFGVVFLLFMIGLELSISRLRNLGGRVFGLGSLQVGITGLLIGGLVWSMGLGTEMAVIIGGGLALSSTAFVLQVLAERGERATRFGLTSFSILLLQDLAVVPLLILVTLLGTANSTFFANILVAVTNGAAALAIVFLFGRFLLRPLYRSISAMRSAELFVSTTLLVVLGTSWLMDQAGLSMALGALLAGLLLAETEFRHQIEADIKPFRGILLGLFFMTIGMSIDIQLIAEHPVLIFLILAGLLIGKSIVTAGLCRLVGLPGDVSIRTGLALSQGGEFGFVMFGAAMTLGLLPEVFAQILMAVIALSMIATPGLFALGKIISSRFAAPIGDGVHAFDADIEDISGHVLIAGFGRVGQTVARVLSDAGISYVALDLDQARVAKARKLGMPVFFGNADQLPVLQAAGVERAKLAVLTLDEKETVSRTLAALRGNYPDLPIFVRARDRRHTLALENIGATAVVSEAAEASLQLGSVVLNSLDVGADDISQVIQSYRDDDYARLEEII